MGRGTFGSRRTWQSFVARHKRSHPRTHVSEKRSGSYDNATPTGARTKGQTVTTPSGGYARQSSLPSTTGRSKNGKSCDSRPARTSRTGRARYRSGSPKRGTTNCAATRASGGPGGSRTATWTTTHRRPAARSRPNNRGNSYTTSRRSIWRASRGSPGWRLGGSLRVAGWARQSRQSGWQMGQWWWLAVCLSPLPVWARPPMRSRPAAAAHDLKSPANVAGAIAVRTLLYGASRHVAFDSS